MDELESYGGDPSNIIMSREYDGASSVSMLNADSISLGGFSRSQESDGSGSTVSADERVPPRQFIQRPDPPREGEAESSSESDSEDEARDIVPPADLSGRMSVDSVRAGLSQYEHRPHSSMSSQQRYRTPLTGSMALSPPPQPRMQSQQPLPNFETPSAFAEPLPPTPANYPSGTQLFSGTPGYNDTQRSQVASPPHLHPSHPSYRPHQPVLGSFQGSNFSRPSSAVALERAVENVQAHLAALQERLETLEARALAGSHTSGSSPRRGTVGSPVRGLGLLGGRGSPNGLVPEPVWDIEDLGMWSVVLNPLSSALSALRSFAMFFARNENRSPSMVILRRLCLDVSFLVCVVGVIGALWRKSGMRRREVKAALLILWRAIVGRPHRVLVDPAK